MGNQVCLSAERSMKCIVYLSHPSIHRPVFDPRGVGSTWTQHHCLGRKVQMLLRNRIGPHPIAESPNCLITKSPN